MMELRNWANVIILGLGFFLLFSAFQTTVFIQTLTIDSYLSPKCVPPGKNGSEPFGVLSDTFAKKVGYYSGAIIYAMVSIGNWVSVSVVATVGAKWSLVFSGMLYVVYIACLIRPLVYTVFIGAFLLGAGGGVLWTAQGQVLIQNSSKERMSTTSGIFWLMLQMSLVVGSIYLFLYFYIERSSSTNLDCFPHKQNNILFSILTLASILGIVVLLFITSQPKKESPSETSSEGSINASHSANSSDRDPLMKSRSSSVMTGVEASGSRQYHPIIQAVINAVRMLLTKNMILLCFTFVYTGYELNYWSGVFGTVIGHTGLFERYHVGAALFFIGMGEIIGGGLFGILGSYTNRWGRDLVVMLGFCCHILVYIISFLFLPNNAIAQDVSPSDSYGALGIYGVMSNIYPVMAAAFLIGLGDASFNTQIYSVIGSLYPTDDKSAPAMALYKFFQSIAAMVGFFTSTFIVLQWQLLILVVFAVLGTITFCLVEWEVYRIESAHRNDMLLQYDDSVSRDQAVTQIIPVPDKQNTRPRTSQDSDSSVY